MAYTEAQKKATEKYRAKNYKRIPLDVQSAFYECVKEFADAHGESVNGFIKRAITEAMQRGGVTHGND